MKILKRYSVMSGTSSTTEGFLQQRCYFQYHLHLTQAF